MFTQRGGASASGRYRTSHITFPEKHAFGFVHHMNRMFGVFSPLGHMKLGNEEGTAMFSITTEDGRIAAEQWLQVHRVSYTVTTSTGLTYGTIYGAPENVSPQGSTSGDTVTPSEQPKPKVGDRVRVTNPDFVSISGDVAEGDIAVVNYVYSSLAVDVTWGDGKDRFLNTLYAHEYEVILKEQQPDQPKPMPKVGDRIRIVAPGAGEGYRVGDTATVTRVYGDFDVDVKWDDPGLEAFAVDYLYRHEFEVIPKEQSAEQPKPMPKVGDRVRVVKIGNRIPSDDYHIDDTGVVEGVGHYDVCHVRVDRTSLIVRLTYDEMEALPQPGDRVRIVKVEDRLGDEDYRVGDTGTVLDSDSGPTVIVLGVTVDRTGSVVQVYPREVEVLPKEQSAEPEEDDTDALVELRNELDELREIVNGILSVSPLGRRIADHAERCRGLLTQLEDEIVEEEGLTDEQRRQLNGFRDAVRSPFGLALVAGELYAFIRDNVPGADLHLS